MWFLKIAFLFYLLGAAIFYGSATRAGQSVHPKVLPLIKVSLAWPYYLFRYTRSWIIKNGGWKNALDKVRKG